MGITRMNHAVLYVRDARRTADFYRRVLDFEVIIDSPVGQYAFLRAPDSANHHDLAVFTIGSAAGDSTAGRQTVGLYHIAWEVPTLDELAAVERRLLDVGALVGASDHGASKSLYAKDPDGLEFEVMWAVPAEFWGEEEHEAVIRPLDIAAEQSKYAAMTTRRNGGDPDA